MESTILRAKATTEFYTEERCHILEVANDDSDPAVSIARARVLPGVTTCWHKLAGTEERYLIIKGSGTVEVGEEPPTQVEEGDVVRIAPDVRQRITNDGDSDLIFYAICTPRFVPGCYVSLESENL